MPYTIAGVVRELSWLGGSRDRSAFVGDGKSITGFHDRWNESLETLVADALFFQQVNYVHDSKQISEVVRHMLLLSLAQGV